MINIVVNTRRSQTENAEWNKLMKKKEARKERWKWNQLSGKEIAWNIQTHINRQLLEEAEKLTNAVIIC